jgi:phosphatidate phosphatase APP1
MTHSAPLPRCTRFAALILTLSTLASADPQVLLFPAIGTTSRVTISGRVIQHEVTGHSKLSKNLRRLTTATMADAPVSVRFRGAEQTAKTDSDGNFSLQFDRQDVAFPIGLSWAEARSVPGAPTTATVQIVADGSSALVISDFDDTLAETHVLDRKKLLRAALLQDETDQPAVQGMAGFIRCLAHTGDNPSGLAVVSGSPTRFAARVAAFLQNNNFPPMALFLRQWNLGPSKDPRQHYKYEPIKHLMALVSSPVVLIGDSAEQDPEVYAQIREEFPGRVKAIYIRDAGNAADPSRFKDMAVFEQPKEALQHAIQRGLAPKDCTL